MLPFKKIPRIMLIHLVKNAALWLNAFPAKDVVSSKYSPRFIMTGKELNAEKHAVLEFGAYVQTHEDHTNDMNQRAVGAICMGPTGNQQGSHWFMNLTTGQRLNRFKLDRVTNGAGSDPEGQPDWRQ